MIISTVGTRWNWGYGGNRGLKSQEEPEGINHRGHRTIETTEPQGGTGWPMPQSLPSFKTSKARRHQYEQINLP